MLHSQQNSEQLCAKRQVGLLTKSTGFTTLKKNKWLQMALPPTNKHLFKTKIDTFVTGNRLQKPYHSDLLKKKNHFFQPCVTHGGQNQHTTTANVHSSLCGAKGHKKGGKKTKPLIFSCDDSYLVK